MEIILIAAMAKNRVIGRNNQIPWHLPGEQVRFKKTTWGHAILMGRKTYESIGRPLPGRRNIVITRNSQYKAPGCEIAHSLELAYQMCTEEERIFNIGGEQLYRQGIVSADTLILSVLNETAEGDTFFPEFSENDFQLVATKKVSQPVPYSIKTFSRIKKQESKTT